MQLFKIQFQFVYELFFAIFFMCSQHLTCIKRILLAKTFIANLCLNSYLRSKKKTICKNVRFGILLICFLTTPYSFFVGTLKHFWSDLKLAFVQIETSKISKLLFFLIRNFWFYCANIIIVIHVRCTWTIGAWW